LARRAAAVAGSGLIEILALDDPRIADYRSVRERDLIGRRDLFIAEGAVVLGHLLGNLRFEMVSAFLAANRAARFAPLIAASAPNAPLYVAEQAVMDAVVGFPLHRGVLAVGRRLTAPTASALLAAAPARALVLVAAGVGNHDNMGGLFRNAAAFGADAILLDAGACDPLYRKAIRVSVGAALRVPYARFEPGADMVGLLLQAGFTPMALTPAGALDLKAVRGAERTAILVGAEGPGLPQAVLERCLTVRIPMATGFDSINVATAAGLALHHVSKLSAAL